MKKERIPATLYSEAFTRWGGFGGEGVPPIVDIFLCIGGVIMILAVPFCFIMFFLT